jgi:hypothetical protein
MTGHVVHAVDENASSFYKRFGFRALSAARRTPTITASALRTAGYAQQWVIEPGGHEQLAISLPYIHDPPINYS